MKADTGSGKGAAFRVALMGLLFALAIALSFLEGLLPSFVPVPGIKLGLSNVVTMYCVYQLGVGRAYTLAAMKAVFVLMTRGWTGAVLSLCGGLLSVTVMLLLLKGTRLGYGPVSVGGAVSHNVGQLLAAAAILRLGAILGYYLPILVLSGIVMGILTSLVLRTLLPFLQKQL